MNQNKESYEWLILLNRDLVPHDEASDILFIRLCMLFLLIPCLLNLQNQSYDIPCTQLQRNTGFVIAQFPNFHFHTLDSILHELAFQPLVALTMNDSDASASKLKKPHTTCSIETVEDPDAKLRMVYLEHEMEQTFRRVVLQIVDGQSPKVAKKSKVMTKKIWDEHVYVLKHWNTGDGNLDVNAFRSKYRSFYGKIKTFSLDVNAKGRTRLMKEYKGKKMIVVSLDEIFGIIKDAHVNDSSHLRAARTHSRIKENYWNVTEKQVNGYVELCPICTSKQPMVKPMKGAKKPIESYSFRDRMQGDLIDFREDPQKYDSDPNAIEYCWLLIVRDHFSRFLWGFELPSKEPKYVARALHKLFCQIGYPLIYHSDNGNEVHGKEVLQEIRTLNPLCYTVTGRPIKPNEQGGVERGIGSIKPTIAARVQDKRKIGIEHASWLTEYPQPLMSLNTTSNKGVGEMAAYETVFGMQYHEPLDAWHFVLV